MLPVLAKVISPIAIVTCKKMVANRVYEGFFYEGFFGAILEDILQYFFLAYLKKTIFVEFCTNAIINVSLFCLAIYVAPIFFNLEFVKLLVCSIYLASILEGSYNFFIKRFPYILKFVIIYRGNLREMITGEIHKKIDTMGLWGWPLKVGFYFFSPMLAKVIIKSIVAFLSKQGLAMGLYIVIFRSIVAPSIVEDATGLVWYEAAIYPFLMTVKYFFPKQGAFIPING